MRIVSEVVLRLRSLVFRRREEREMAEELRFHIDMETEKNLQLGMTRTEARRQALITFGGLERIKERTRDARGLRWFDDLVTDARLAVRTLGRNRAFAATTVLTLTFGIGANTAIFSVVQGVLVRPLPYPDADRIVRVAAGARPKTGLDEIPFSRQGYWHFADNQESFEAFGDYHWDDRVRAALTDAGPPEDIIVARVSSSAFEVLGIQPQLGRLPTLEDEELSNSVAVISHEMWAGRYASDPSVIGRDIADDWPVEIIGVMRPGFDFPSPEVDVWRITGLNSASREVTGFQAGMHGWSAIGRLKPGVTLEQATADAEALIAGFAELDYEPADLEGLFDGTAIVRPIKDEIVGGARTPLLIALATAVFVLLISCSNVANLLLVRSESRSREQAIRLALGSSRGRLTQYIMMESAILTLAGTVGGVALAFVGTSILVASAPAGMPRLDQVGLNTTVLLVTTAVSIVAALFFCLAPSWAARSRGPRDRLRSGVYKSTMDGKRSRVLDGLVVTQTALGLILLVGSGLMIRSFQQLRSVDPGFEVDGVLTFWLTVSVTELPRGPSGFYFELLDRLAEVPGVESVAGTESLPMTGVVREIGSATLGTVQIDEFPAAEGELNPNFITKRTTPGYFETMGIPIVEGREFTRDDYSPNFTETAFIVSAAVKRKYWPDESALGKRLTWGRLNGPIVGVAGDVRHRGLEVPAEEIVHSAQIIGRTMMIAVRTAHSPGRVFQEVGRATRELAPGVPITRVRMMSDILADSFSRTSFTMNLLVLAGLLSLLLAAVGLYGVLSHVIHQRSREMALRLALGADPGRVRSMVVLRGVKLGLVGVVIGLGGAAILSRFLGSLLFGVPPLDMRTYVIASVVLLGVAVASSAIPALRAAATPPATALRCET